MKIDPNTLSLEEACRFETMIDDSITSRYDGELDRGGEDLDGALAYTPLNTDAIRNLLHALWGELLTPEAIESAFDRLMDHSTWPHGWCQADEDERPLSDYRTDEDEASDWLEAVASGEIAAEV